MSLIAKGLSNRKFQNSFSFLKGRLNYISSILGKTGLEHRTQIAIFISPGRWITGVERYGFLDADEQTDRHFIRLFVRIGRPPLHAVRRLVSAALSVFGHCGLHDQYARLEARDHPAFACIDCLAFRLSTIRRFYFFCRPPFCRSCRISGSPLCVLPARVLPFYLSRTATFRLISS